MSYIKFQDDPIAQRFNSSYANLCSSSNTKKIVKLLDKCFTIINGSKTEASFCDFGDLVYPADGHMMIDFEVCAGETLSIYNNQLEDILASSPSGTPLNYPLGADGEYMQAEDPSGTPKYYLLDNERTYARGCILAIYYPAADKNGNDILPANKTVELDLTNRLGVTSSFPLADSFLHFANAETRNANSLINKIEITNPNQTFSIKVRGMVIYVRSNSDPSDCAC